jgi:hypothetical protein
MNKPDTSVVIPTRDRPDDLRRALTSVARQDALSSISEVIVIENSTNLVSREVCQGFGGLPIRWLHNDPPLPMSAWANRVFGSPEADSEFFALLCDDDWWEPHHLSRAVNGMRLTPSVAVTWSGCIEYDSYNRTAMPRGHTVWSVTRHSSDALEVDIALPQVLLANLLTTPFHISTLVTRQKALARVLPMVANGNPFDIDRHLACVLATQGKTSYYPPPSIGVAAHAGRESITLGRTKEAERWWKRTTREIVGLAEAADIDLSGELDSLLQQSVTDVPTLLGHAYFDGCKDLEQVLPVSNNFRAASRRLRLALRLRRYLPPAALKLCGLGGWMARNLPHAVLA